MFVNCFRNVKGMASLLVQTKNLALFLLKAQGFPVEQFESRL